MKIVFFGTPPFAADILLFLIKNDVDIIGVVTQSDKRRNNSKKQINVKKIAEEYLPSIPLFQPEKASSIDFINELKELDADLFVVVAYGQILKQELIDIPRLDIINVHASLLPKYRGAAPIERAIMNGDEKTGITIMKIVKKMDAGSILLQKEIPISSDMNSLQLREKLCEVAKPLLLKAIEDFEKGLVKYLPQDESKATYAHKISNADRQIIWSMNAKQIYNLIRALSPTPCGECFISINGKKKLLKVKNSKVVNKTGNIGEVLQFEKDLFIVACKDKAIQLLEVQLEGKKTMPAEDFIKGIKGKVIIS